MTEQESRRKRRYEIRVAAEVTANQDILQSATKNLSESGICLITRQPLREGTQVQISLFLVVDGIEDTTTPSIEINAQVVWSAPSSESEFLAGCQFIGVAGESEEALKGFLNHFE